MDTIAVIEDHIDLRQSMVDLLEINGFKVRFACDGYEGAEMIRLYKPDLVVSDIMMPNLDGLELLKLIRADASTQHIPVIFVTARTTMENKLEGLENGANDYITKPFEMKELILKIKNLLRFRDKSLISSQSASNVSSIESQDERFIRSLDAAIEGDLGNVDLSMADVASILEISPSSLQKKIKRITDKSVSQYIREYRLTRSRDLILANYGSLVEIATKTGFRTPSYFSNSFKTFFGVAPSTIKSNH